MCCLMNALFLKNLSHIKCQPLDLLHLLFHGSLYPKYISLTQYVEPIIVQPNVSAPSLTSPSSTSTHSSDSHSSSSPSPSPSHLPSHTPSNSSSSISHSSSLHVESTINIETVFTSAPLEMSDPPGHHMVTRRKVGIFKPKVYYSKADGKWIFECSAFPDNTIDRLANCEPRTVTKALSSPL